MWWINRWIWRQVYKTKPLTWAEKILVLLIVLILLAMSGCAEENPVKNSLPATQEQTTQTVSQEKPAPTPKLTAYEIITMVNHPRLADKVEDVQNFYQSLPAGNTGDVRIVEGKDEAPGSVIYFKKTFDDVSKVVCYFSKADKKMAFGEAKPIVLSYFPIEMVRENFIYEKGYRLTNGTGTVLYAWSYKPSGANYYKGQPPYGGNLTVAVKEEQGTVTAFGMFYGTSEDLPFIKEVKGYTAEFYEVEFE